MTEMNAALSINVEQLAAMCSEKVFKIFFVVILKPGERGLVGNNCQEMFHVFKTEFVVGKECRANQLCSLWQCINVHPLESFHIRNVDVIGTEAIKSLRYFCLR